MSKLLETLLTPEQKAQADRIDASIALVSGLLAERAVLDTATRALDVSRRAAFEAVQQGVNLARRAGVHDSLDPEYMQGQIVEARAALDLADKALCGWYGQINPERARLLMSEAIDFLAEE